MYSSSMVYGIIKSILCVGTAGSYVLGGPRRRRRRRINLSYHQRIRRLSSGIERLSKRRCGPCSSDEKPGKKNMTTDVTDNEDKEAYTFDSEAVSSFLAKKNGCCSNRVVIARVDDKIIEIEIVRLDISLN
jgi:hypothetical protein